MQFNSLAFVLAGLGFVALPAAAQSLQAYAGAVAGQAHGSAGTFACATSGPTIGNGWYAGLVLPTEGISACNLVGGIDNQTGSTGPLAASQSVSGPVENGSYSGSAAAHADYWRLGVSAQGTMTGASGSSTYNQSAAFASFSVPVTLISPSLATGSAGMVNFSLLVEGLLNNLPNAPYTQQGDVRLGIRVNGQPYSVWYAFSASSVNSNLPIVHGGASGLPGDFTLTPGSLSGSATITSTAGFQFQWGVPFEVEMALYTTVTPCCYGASIDADFYDTASLTGIQAYGPNGQLVTDFTGWDGAGNQLDAQGLVAAVPEPGSFSLLLAGMACLAAQGARTRAQARRTG